MTTDISVGVRYDFITRLLYYILPLLSLRFITLHTEVYKVIIMIYMPGGTP